MILLSRNSFPRSPQRHSSSRPERPARRRRATAVRPGLEALEGRVVMTLSPFDPTFGTAGTVLGALDTGNAADLSNATAVAVQPDGKIVVAGTYTRAATTTVGGGQELAVRRYNADGTLDATFGTNGQADIPLPTPYTAVALAPDNVVVGPDGSIVLAAEIGQTFGTGTGGPVSNAIIADESIVVRLTSAGQLDANFGTNGEYNDSALGGSLTTVAVQADGKIVAAGLVSTVINSPPPNELVVRLTTAGVLDTSFNSTGSVIVTPSGLIGASNSGSVAALRVDPAGDIYVAGDQSIYLGFSDNIFRATISKIQGDGTVDTTFGTDGTAFPLSGSNPVAVADMALQPGGGFILVGGEEGDAFVIRAGADGTLDPTFKLATPTATTPSLAVTYKSVAIQPDGAIVVGGSTQNPSQSQPQGIPAVGIVDRYLATGAIDPSFGLHGRITARVTPTYVSSPLYSYTTQAVNGVALTASGDVVAVGSTATIAGFPKSDSYSTVGTQAVVSQLLPVTLTPTTPGDYDGDGKADVAAELASFGAFAYRQSSGQGDVISVFGPTGVGATIPAPGDYDGDGRTDIAAYLPAYGVLAYRPSSGGADVIVPFGIPGAGQSIPAPGDYDGDGRTDVAVYLPTYGILAYRPSAGGPDVLRQFGFAGTDGSIPAPGDYDGDGKTDLAVYLPSLGELAYRPSTGGADVFVPFGIPGAGQTIPAPGDYDGDGRTDVAAYLPSLGLYAYRPSSGGADVLAAFGLTGAGASIPAPGDYDGDGRTDMAVYLPTLALFTDRPSSGGADVVEQFGATGDGQTVPASSIPYAQPASTAAASVSAASVGVLIPLTDDLMDSGTTSTARQKSRRG